MTQCGFYANQCPTGYNKISGFGLLGLPELITQDWAGLIWFVWFLWFIYFIPVKKNSKRLRA
jgi:hypothetical protein